MQRSAAVLPIKAGFLFALVPFDAGGFHVVRPSRGHTEFPLVKGRANQRIVEAAIRPTPRPRTSPPTAPADSVGCLVALVLVVAGRSCVRQLAWSLRRAPCADLSGGADLKAGTLALTEAMYAGLHWTHAWDLWLVPFR